jgi:hypothetical protein
MNCRCGHGRHAHRRASGKIRVPCQAIVQVERPGYRVILQGGEIAQVAPRLVLAVCKCRDFVQAVPSVR